MELPPKLETIEQCPLCGSKEKRFILTNTDRMHGIPGEFGLNQCLKCSVFYISPRPTLKDLSSYYPDDYPSHQERQALHGVSILARKLFEYLRNTVLYEIYHYKNYENKSRIRPSIIAKPIAYCLAPLWERARFNLPEILPYSENIRALDIGCGPGYYMLALQKLGYKTQGIELSENAARIGREKFKLDISTGTLLEYRFPDNYFHVIIMNHALEHIHNPVDVLREIKRILHPDGITIIRMPNMNSLGYKIFKKDWGPLETPRHLILYSKQSLLALSGIIGLRLKSFSTKASKDFILWSKEYEITSAKGMNTYGRTSNVSLFQKFCVAILTVYEKILVASGKDSGEELVAVLTK